MYLIGVDGGGTKTESMVADLDGNIIATGEGGSANFRDLGIKEAVKNITEAVEKSLLEIKNKEISSIFIGAPAFAEEYKEREEEIRKEFLRNIKSFSINEERVFIGSDQEVAFRAGTDKSDGVVVIAGTGSVSRGWNSGKEFKTDGWGYLTDSSGAYQIGQKVYQRVIQSLDKREKETLLTEMVLEFFKAKTIIDLNKIIYQNNLIKNLAPLSLCANDAAKKGDVVAKNILDDASKELAIATKNTIEKLEFKKDFPLVLVGGLFRSDIFLNNFQREILENVPRVEIILLEKKSSKGAVKLAKEEYKKLK